MDKEEQTRISRLDVQISRLEAEPEKNRSEQISRLRLKPSLGLGKKEKKEQISRLEAEKKEH
eukprot:173422-Hanusia_phi.AAC.1